MKINQYTSILGEKIILIPYRKDHVQKYHEWMKSPEIQELTASEPLTIIEEYEMQKSWAMDQDKCTFIILDQNKYNETKNEIDSMIGDVNIFLTNPGDKHSGEVEIMIAEPSFRGCGNGKEALLCMLRYDFAKQYFSRVYANSRSKFRFYTRFEGSNPILSHSKLSILTLARSKVVFHTKIKLSIRVN